MDKWKYTERYSGEKLREIHTRWFSHIQKIAINASVRKIELIQVEGTKKR